MATVVDGVLVQWGERLFYPRNRRVPATPEGRLDVRLRRQATVIRRRIESTVRRAPQVMVKVTGGGRGMGAIAAHFRYISKNGRLTFEDDRGVEREGKAALHDLAEQWRWGGSLIGETSHRREAFNIMLSMPRGTDSQKVLQAAREFAKIELHDHRYVMVLHDHQENPHVHLSVRAESMTGKRLNPRKADLHRWRETFADRLRGLGVDAEATRQATRGVTHRYEHNWQIKARSDGRLMQAETTAKSGAAYRDNRLAAVQAWAVILVALRDSAEPADRELAKRIGNFVSRVPFMKEVHQLAQARKQQRDRAPAAPVHQAERARTIEPSHSPTRSRDIER